jgi:hypothetical protein
MQENDVYRVIPVFTMQHQGIQPVVCSTPAIQTSSCSIACAWGPGFMLQWRNQPSFRYPRLALPPFPQRRWV